jgi:hypothetical protein
VRLPQVARHRCDDIRDQPVTRFPRFLRTTLNPTVPLTFRSETESALDIELNRKNGDWDLTSGFIELMKPKRPAASKPVFDPDALEIPRDTSFVRRDPEGEFPIAFKLYIWKPTICHCVAGRYFINIPVG